MTQKILYISGHVAELPARLRPLPPTDSGAPHSNMFRLIEYVAQNYYEQFSIDVVSPLEQAASNPSQIGSYQRLHANYHSVLIPDRWRKLSYRARKSLRYSDAILDRLFRAPSLQGLYYLRRVKHLYDSLEPDIVIHDEGPQFINGLARFVPKEKLYFYCRGDMGLSRKHLHLPYCVLVTNRNLGNWVCSVNTKVLQTAVVPNSLDRSFEHLPLNPRRFEASLRRIVYVGRIVPEKGIQQLIQAFAEVYKRSKVPLVLEIIGAGLVNKPNSLDEKAGLTPFEREMRLLAHKLLPPEAITWRGWLSRQEVLAVYQNAHLAVYPSTCVEGFGMVALEAMACGVPVIASRRPGFESLLAEGGGILVDPENIQEMADAILRVLMDSSLAQELARKGYEHAQHYTVDAAAKSLVSTLNGVYQT